MTFIILNPPNSYINRGQIMPCTHPGIGHHHQKAPARTLGHTMPCTNTVLKARFAPLRARAADPPAQRLPPPNPTHPDRNLARTQRKRRRATCHDGNMGAARALRSAPRARSHTRGHQASITAATRRVAAPPSSKKQHVGAITSPAPHCKKHKQLRLSKPVPCLAACVASLHRKSRGAARFDPLRSANPRAAPRHQHRNAASQRAALRTRRSTPSASDAARRNQHPMRQPAKLPATAAPPQQQRQNSQLWPANTAHHHHNTSQPSATAPIPAHQHHSHTYSSAARHRNPATTTPTHRHPQQLTTPPPACQTRAAPPPPPPSGPSRSAPPCPPPRPATPGNTQLPL